MPLHLLELCAHNTECPGYKQNNNDTMLAAIGTLRLDCIYAWPGSAGPLGCLKGLEKRNAALQLELLSRSCWQHSWACS
jgi:hypothetical protein